MAALLPIPRVPVSVRVATPADIPFVDALQKTHSRQVGWMPTKQIEGKIAAGQVLVAQEEAGSCELVVDSAGRTGPSPLLPINNCQRSTLLGYVIGQDRYFKRDDVGIIYQLNVAPGRQRGFVGATLLKAVFERSAWGCRLFCCWCAQDIAANRFWEAMGFVPLAFRTGSERKSRVHIFWQKRIRQGDTATPWWYPSQTGAGAIREDRLVLPIPPGTHWSDAKPMILPEGTKGLRHESEGNRRLPPSGTKRAGAPADAPRRDPALRASVPPCLRASAQRQAVTRTTGLRFGVPRAAGVEAKPAEAAATGPREKKPRPKACPERGRRNDPKLVAAARELRDRWLEHVNAGQASLDAAGKYDVTRALTDRPSHVALLPAA